jgi:hypothetical protein
MKLLARSRAGQSKGKDLDRLLFGLFNVPVADRDDLPLTPLILRLHGISIQPDYYYMFADPVQLRTDRDNVIMMGNDHLEISDMDAARLIHNINMHYPGDEIRLESISNRHWFLSIPQVPNMHTTPLSRVLGKSIRPYLPDGEDGRYWRGILNEIQMLLSTDDVNRARDEEGKPVINSLWFWGGGQMPARTQTSWTSVCGRSSLLRALAMNAGIDCENCPVDANSWYASSGPGDHLVMLDETGKYMAYGNDESWHKQMGALEANWFSPLLDLLKSDRLSSLTLYLNTTNIYNLTGRMARRWWKDVAIRIPRL